MLVLKQEYNELLMRHCTAIYRDRLGKYKDQEKFDKWQPEYEKIISRLSIIIEELMAQGIKPTGDEILGGFDI